MAQIILRDVDISSLPKYPTEPFDADAMIRFLQAKMNHQRMYFESDSDYYDTLAVKELKRGINRPLSIATLNNVRRWAPTSGRSFSIHTLERVWNAVR